MLLTSYTCDHARVFTYKFWLGLWFSSFNMLCQFSVAIDFIWSLILETEIIQINFWCKASWDLDPPQLSQRQFTGYLLNGEILRSSFSPALAEILSGADWPSKLTLSRSIPSANRYFIKQPALQYFHTRYIRHKILWERTFHKDEISFKKQEAKQQVEKPKVQHNRSMHQ